MSLFRKKAAAPDIGAESAGRSEGGFYRVEGIPGACEKELYSRLREQVPIIDACIGKIIRLVGGFRAVAEDERFQNGLDGFVRNIRVGASGVSLHTFLDCYLDSLLTYGSALAEIVYDRGGGVSGIYVAPMRKIEVREGGRELSRRTRAFEAVFCPRRDKAGRAPPSRKPHLYGAVSDGRIALRGICP